MIWSWEPVATSSIRHTEVTPATTVSGPSTACRQGPAKARPVIRKANPRMVAISPAIALPVLHHGTSCARKLDTATAALTTATTWVAASSREPPLPRRTAMAAAR
ncbi:hypothetical protein DP939_00570 [Spongiactinospora rosea]|uniref:Uncharacterized protein n=1 Tax=Spongiactinospora rosea TaxID=2248750 RepID=A0A366M6U1_9ACTN|nr:hypothetical protein DP939_00570 [Spongiactinospora rosea]